jgi:hypothetical protein
VLRQALLRLSIADGRRDWSGDYAWHELSLRWLPVPAGGDLGRGPCLSAYLDHVPGTGRSPDPGRHFRRRRHSQDVGDVWKEVNPLHRGVKFADVSWAFNVVPPDDDFKLVPLRFSGTQLDSERLDLVRIV